LGILELPLELNLKEHYSFYMFDELTKEITKDLEAKASRKRAKRDDAQDNLCENSFLSDLIMQQDNIFAILQGTACFGTHRL